MERVPGLVATAILVLVLANNAVVPGHASDPDILKDFLVPPSLDPTHITQQFFTFTNFRYALNVNLTGKTAAVVKKASKKEFPALDGQGVSVSKLIFPPSGINPPHTHPRAAELLIVLEGVLEVAFIDTTNRIFTQTVQAHDLFIFPKGLLHYQVNMGKGRAVALGVYGSASAGTVSIPSAVFGSGIDAGILAKSFKTDEKTVSKIVAANK